MQTFKKGGEQKYKLSDAKRVYKSNNPNKIPIYLNAYKLTCTNRILEKKKKKKNQLCINRLIAEDILLPPHPLILIYLQDKNQLVIKELLNNNQYFSSLFNVKLVITQRYNIKHPQDIVVQ